MDVCPVHEQGSDRVQNAMLALSSERTVPPMFRRISRTLFRSRTFGVEIYALYLAARDPRTPWYARVLAAIVAAYALSPLDLIPDPIPVLGLLDDIILIPIGLKLVTRLIPEALMIESREKAAVSTITRPRFWRWIGIASAIIVLIWLLLLGLLLYGIVIWLW